MICTVILNGKKYFLDGTEDFIALNDYAQRIQGKQVLIEDGKNYFIEKVPEFAAERNKEKKHFKMAVAAAQLSGTGSIEYAGESKINVQRAFTSIRNDNREESLLRFLRKGDENISLSNIKNSDFTERQKALQVQFDFKASHQVTTSGNELYIVMDWEKEFADAEISADRKNDFEFSQKYYLSTQSELQIPEGYKVDYLPTALKKITPHYSFEGSYTQKGNTVVYSKTIIVHKPILKKSDFASWNTFIADINTFYNDQIVLKK